MELEVTKPGTFTVKCGEEKFTLRKPKMKQQAQLERALKSAQKGEAFASEIMMDWVKGLADDECREKFSAFVDDLEQDAFVEMVTKINNVVAVKKN